MADSKKISSVANTSENVVNENLGTLRRVFPQFIKENQIDFDALKAFFEQEGILAGEEKYGLNWAGKSNAFKLIRRPSVGTLTPDEKESVDWDKTQNLFIEGDNLEVLKLLQKHYREKIKMIYIDPPYNTGKDRVYKDDYKENISEYYERTGQSKDGIKLITNPESSGRYHSYWLTMMYPRLFLARNLLQEDGVIFISIDDNEVHNLRHLMDEIFGQENFVAQIIWQKNYSPRNDAKYFSDMHDYIVCYSRVKEKFGRLLLPRTEEQNSRYINRDNDPRGPWKAENLAAKRMTPNDIYPIKTPSGRSVYPPKGSSWRVSRKKFIELMNDNRIWFGENGNNVPSKKSFLSEVQQGKVPVTIWFREEVGDNQEAVRQMQALFQTNLFESPKPTGLISKMLKITTSNEDIVLDFFAGSGTTAHAVMDLNAEGGGNRKWICVQLPEETEENSEARKAGFNTISEIARERIRRAAKKIGGENKGKKLDLGFKAYVLQKSNYRQWNVLTDKDDEEKLKKQMKLYLEKPLVDGYDEKSVVYEILLKEGFSLNSNVESEQVNGLTIWTITDNDKRMIVCFAKQLTKDQIENFKLGENDTFVCFDSALDDTTKVNITRNSNIKVI